MENLDKIQKLVGNITEEDLKHVDCEPRRYPLEPGRILCIKIKRIGDL